MAAKDLFDVAGLVVAVTGGAGGLGRGICEGFAARGAKVVVLDIDRGRVDEAVTVLRDTGEVSGELMDVTSQDSVTRAYDAILRRHGRIDAVFANAGISTGPGYLGWDGKRAAQGALENLDGRTWDAVIATDLSGVMATLRGAVPTMKRQNSGSIVVTTSIAWLMHAPTAQTAYVAAKAGAAALVRQCAPELAKFGIRVNAIAPGPIATGITNPEAAARYAEFVPMKTTIGIQDIQGLAVFLAAPASRFITGAEIPIDGGGRFTYGD